MKKTTTLITFLLLSICVFGQSKKWTLRECVEYALENNISIQQSELNVENAEVDKLVADGNFLPSLNASSSISENTGLSFNPVTNNPQTTTFLSVTGRINVGYTVFDGLRNLRQLQRAKLSRLAAEYNLEQMKDDISLAVANAFLEIILNKENLKVVEAQNEVTQKQIEQTRELVDGGVIPRGDLLEIQATNANEQQRIVAARNAVEISKISLAQLLALQNYQEFDVVEGDYGIFGEELVDTPVGAIVEGAEENRFEIKIAEQNLALAEKDLQLSRGAYYPTLSAFFGYDTRYTDASSFQQFPDPNDPVTIREIGFVQETGQSVVGEFPNTILREVGADPFIDQLYQNDGIGYGFSLNIPVFNGFATRASVKRSKISVKRQQYLLEQAKLDLESNIYQAYTTATAARESYRAALKALESQELAYEYAEERYSVGLINAFDFSQSKLRYDNALIELNRSKYDYIFRIKVLELFFGIEATELKF
ncbi:TolC family protein [Croceiramulus getboli]|nr:TolC family protein [Flavobacteriaceae bacterium YJPT1-3]